MRFLIAFLVFSIGLQAQDAPNEKQLVKKAKKAKDLVYEGNELLQDNRMIEAEMEFRKALSEKKDNVAGAYNLAHAYYENGSFDEALFRVEQAAKHATSKADKHKAYHNIGNILMQNKQCKAAVEAFKNALRNNPTDDETRYNLALAQECAKEEDGGGEDNKEDENKQNDQDKKDQDQQKDKDDQQEEKDKKEDQGDKDKKKGEEEEDDKGKPKDEKDDKNKGDENKDKQKQKPQPGKMSPQQIKNILEAMSNQEQKVQEKINAQKQKGAKVKTEKDW